MTKLEIQSAAAIPVILLIGTAIAWAGSQNGIQALGIPLFALCGLCSLAINWSAFVGAFAFTTERYFDLTGSMTYMGLVALAVGLRGESDPRSLILAALIALWALRLGSFLFIRVNRDGSDRRFDQIKISLPRFLMVWTLQALWVFLTAACALAAMTSSEVRPLGIFAALGCVVWAAGFAIEVAADKQKRRFRADSSNRDRFIQSGLWAWSRHPNYFGEITLWIGIALIAVPVLSGWQLATLISPVFVYLLLTRISGVPLLEARAKKKWGEDPEFVAYMRSTPSLFPRPPRPV
jgi:steroid 5-alpha reductase family enzyme